MKFRLKQTGITLKGTYDSKKDCGQFTAYGGGNKTCYGQGNAEQLLLDTLNGIDDLIKEKAHISLIVFEIKAAGIIRKKLKQYIDGKVLQAFDKFINDTQKIYPDVKFVE